LQKESCALHCLLLAVDFLSVPVAASHVVMKPPVD